MSKWHKISEEVPTDESEGTVYKIRSKEFSVLNGFWIVRNQSLRAQHGQLFYPNRKLISRWVIIGDKTDAGKIEWRYAKETELMAFL